MEAEVSRGQGGEGGEGGGGSLEEDVLQDSSWTRDEQVEERAEGNQSLHRVAQADRVGAQVLAQGNVYELLSYPSILLQFCVLCLFF